MVNYSVLDSYIRTGITVLRKVLRKNLFKSDLYDQWRKEMAGKLGHDAQLQLIEIWGKITRDYLFIDEESELSKSESPQNKVSLQRPRNLKEFHSFIRQEPGKSKFYDVIFFILGPLLTISSATIIYCDRLDFIRSYSYTNIGYLFVLVAGIALILCGILRNSWIKKSQTDRRSFEIKELLDNINKRLANLDSLKYNLDTIKQNLDYIMDIVEDISYDKSEGD